MSRRCRPGLGTTSGTSGDDGGGGGGGNKKCKCVPDGRPPEAPSCEGIFDEDKLLGLPAGSGNIEYYPSYPTLPSISVPSWFAGPSSGGDSWFKSESSLILPTGTDTPSSGDYGEIGFPAEDTGLPGYAINLDWQDLGGSANQKTNSGYTYAVTGKFRALSKFGVTNSLVVGWMIMDDDGEEIASEEHTVAGQDWSWAPDPPIPAATTFYDTFSPPPGPSMIGWLRVYFKGNLSDSGSSAYTIELPYPDNLCFGIDSIPE